MEKYETLQHELASLAAYIDETRRTLGGVQEKLPRASDTLSEVTKATERATHNILEMVEKLMDRDAESETDLSSLEQACPGDAVSRLRERADERTMVLTEMMTELSFQDLTCQAIQKISNLILEVERRILSLIEVSITQELPEEDPNQFSGLARLDESSTGRSRQDLIDQLLGGGR